MINVKKDTRNNSFRLILTPNRSMSWRQMLVFYLITCVLALTIALFFLIQGLWMILPFSGLEMLVLGVGLYLTSLDAYRFEVITVDAELVKVSKGRRNPDQKWEFKKAWVSLDFEKSTSCLQQTHVKLGSHGKFVVIGDFLNNKEKDDLAFQLKDCIIRS